LQMVAREGQKRRSKGGWALGNFGFANRAESVE